MNSITNDRGRVCRSNVSEFPPSLQVVPWRAEAFVVVALCAALEVQMSVNGAGLLQLEVSVATYRYR